MISSKWNLFYLSFDLKQLLEHTQISAIDSLTAVDATDENINAVKCFICKISFHKAKKCGKISQEI